MPPPSSALELAKWTGMCRLQCSSLWIISRIGTCLAHVSMFGIRLSSHFAHLCMIRAPGVFVLEETLVLVSKERMRPFES